MSSTALPTRRSLRRSGTAQSSQSAGSARTTPNDSNNTSPFDSPQRSPSSTSLSSLSSEPETPNGAKAAAKPKLRDSYGNDFELPDYTIKQIRDAIPAHCFERSAVTGFSYIFRDIACLAAVFYCYYNYCTPEYVPNVYARGALWAVYTFMQGLFATGLWVIAHECGHQSFSPSKVLNDTVGWVLHSSLLVPYFSWKISHGKHHKATGHIERDMVFCPATREEFASSVGKLAHELTELVEETPLFTAGHLIFQQLLGWPGYLFVNVTGHDFHERQTEGKGKGKHNGFGGGVNHFMPSSPLYERKDEHLILLSDLGLAIAGGILFFLGQRFGWTNMLVWYWLPYLWVNHWLVAITYLQHTDPSLPHYDNNAWNFVRGAAATIDRDFWPIGPHLLHGIIETHVLHHYISTIPFYHADEATAAIKPVMGRHYRSDTAGGAFGFLASLWTSSRWCKWVEPVDENSGVLFFRNPNRLGELPAELPAPKTASS